MRGIQGDLLLSQRGPLLFAAAECAVLFISVATATARLAATVKFGEVPALGSLVSFGCRLIISYNSKKMPV